MIKKMYIHLNYMVSENFIIISQKHYEQERHNVNIKCIYLEHTLINNLLQQI